MNDVMQRLSGVEIDPGFFDEGAGAFLNVLKTAGGG